MKKSNNKYNEMLAERMTAEEELNAEIERLNGLLSQGEAASGKELEAAKRAAQRAEDSLEAMRTESSEIKKAAADSIKVRTDAAFKP